VSFSVAADAYDRFMGRYSSLLADPFADLAGVGAGQRVLDVGCGPGALTAELVRRLGDPSAVAAADPSDSFVAAVTDRLPGVDVRQAPAEDLPFADASFDVALAQLVVHFMRDPLAGIREMARVTRSDGVVAACVWDLAKGGHGPLRMFWEAAGNLDPSIEGESVLTGVNEGELGRLLREAGLRTVEERPVEVRLVHPTFDDWWQPFTLGVGPAGAHAAGLDDAARARLRAECRRLVPDEPFTVRARAWAARGIV
jgi:SAM-dependent methyltransferase